MYVQENTYAYVCVSILGYVERGGAIHSMWCNSAKVSQSETQTLPVLICLFLRRFDTPV